MIYPNRVDPQINKSNRVVFWFFLESFYYFYENRNWEAKSRKGQEIRAAHGLVETVSLWSRRTASDNAAAKKLEGFFPKFMAFFGDGLFGFEYRKHRKKLVSFDHKHWIVAVFVESSSCFLFSRLEQLLKASPFNDEIFWMSRMQRELQIRLQSFNGAKRHSP